MTAAIFRVNPTGRPPSPAYRWPISQLEGVREINHLDTVTPEVVEAAREALLIGR
jgi:hypothetical protein